MGCFNLILPPVPLSGTVETLSYRFPLLLVNNSPLYPVDRTPVVPSTRAALSLAEPRVSVLSPLLFTNQLSCVPSLPQVYPHPSHPVAPCIALRAPPSGLSD
ncbi:hypothetical protein DPEC_G00149010 [Dallia pectoralis]|uniref:Uncharacterized protein n=1 Tax=Dallia pectoralis TaxID=75939 RepID=A0ACC2GIN9_DALPE|nr:hypothetical protein DPEC_G00149010 [Dallia pectoralis]